MRAQRNSIIDQMAKVNVTSYTFQMTITQISKLESIWSPSVHIHGVPWQVNVLKIGKKDQRTLGIYLYCMSKDTTSNWSYSAIATFKLLPINNSSSNRDPEAEAADTIVYHLQPHIFDCSDLGFGAADLIKWTDLINKKYRHDDTIKLEIHITVDDPTKSNRCELKLKNLNRRCKTGCLTTFQLKVKNVSNLMAIKSSKFFLYNMPWTLTFYKDHNPLGNFGIYLQSSSSEFPKNESYRIRMSMILLTSNEHVAPIVKKTTTQQIGSFGTLSIRNIIAWNELMKSDNGFIKKNAIKVEIQIKMDKMIGDGVLNCTNCGNINNDGVGRNGKRTSSATLQMQCVICWENFSSQEICCTPCGHLFCVSCITAAVQNRANCPLCNLEVQMNALRRLYLPV